MIIVIYKPLDLGIDMKNIKTLFSLTILAFLLCSSLSFAQGDSVKLKPGHPQQYVVQKDDTLWDISSMFLNEPWYWPEIWHSNPQIKNPDLIYPGDILKLIYVDGKAYISRYNGKRTIRLSPEAKIEELNQAIPTIPLDIISPYLTQNRILNSHEYQNLPYIVAIKDEHMSAGANNLIYVMGMPEDSNETTYGIYRRGTAYKNPANQREILGYEAVYLGEGIIQKQGSPSTVFVESSKSEILEGHRLIPINNDKLVTTNFFPKASILQRSARIIGVLASAMQSGVTMVGDTDVVTIDVGLKDGVEIGDVFNIYKKGPLVDDPIIRNTQVKLPDEISGNLMVFRPFNRVSYALIMDAQSTLSVGDIIKSPFLDD